MHVEQLTIGEVAGGCLEAPGDSVVQKASNNEWIGMLNKMKPDNLSKETTKHDQTPATSSESLESLSQVPPPFIVMPSS